MPAPRAPAILERKFYWDELYDVLFYRPTVGLARALDALVERPLIAGSITAVARDVRLLVA